MASASSRPASAMSVRAAASASASASVSASPSPSVPAPMDAALEARLLALSRELRCLVCRNESLADSQAGLAVDLRREMRDLMVAGRTDAEIVDYLVARYGDFVRYRPPLAPRTWLLWGAPAAGLAVGLGLVAAIVRRRRLAAGEAPLDPAERERLARLLSEDAP